MNKQRLRFLSIGFLLSALILSGFQLFYPMDSQVEKADTTAAVGSDGYKEKYESLLVEVELLKKTADSNESEPVADANVTDSSASTATSQSVAVSTPSTNTTTKFVILEGQATSIVIDNLVNAGIITDRAVFEQYLADRNLLYKINYGEYDLSADMGYEVIADIITLE